MNKLKNILKKIRHKFFVILFWSVVSAAFIGPGTVTTLTKAGVYYHFDLMWTILFSIFACLLLQEASARITIYSGMNLGEAIAKQFAGKKSRGAVIFSVIMAIVLGSAAYEAGNILGSIEGLHFIFPHTDKLWFVTIVALLAIIALNLKSIRIIAQFLGAFVFLMGFAFLFTAIVVKPDIDALLLGSFIPTIPDVPGAGILILGIIGTTVVPYDIFLGSGIIDKTHNIRDVRFGLSVAIILGGIISMSIMTVGSALTAGWSEEALKNLTFSFDIIKDALYLNSYINEYAVYIFGIGMFAAGFTSAITAPLASAITTRSLLNQQNNEKWGSQSLRFRLLTITILAVGLTFGFLQVKPVPAIILAQAFNGLILPFISIFLMIVINNPEIMGKKRINSHFSNILMSFVVWITTVIGILNIYKAIERAIKFKSPNSDTVFWIISILAFLITIYVVVKIYKFRKEKLVILQQQND